MRAEVKHTIYFEQPKSVPPVTSNAGCSAYNILYFLPVSIPFLPLYTYSIMTQRGFHVTFTAYLVPQLMKRMT